MFILCCGRAPLFAYSKNNNFVIGHFPSDPGRGNWLAAKPRCASQMSLVRPLIQKVHFQPTATWREKNPKNGHTGKLRCSLSCTNSTLQSTALCLPAVLGCSWFCLHLVTLYVIREKCGCGPGITFCAMNHQFVCPGLVPKRGVKWARRPHH